MKPCSQKNPEHPSAVLFFFPDVNAVSPFLRKFYVVPLLFPIPILLPHKKPKVFSVNTVLKNIKENFPDYVRRNNFPATWIRKKQSIYPGFFKGRNPEIRPYWINKLLHRLLFLPNKKRRPQLGKPKVFKQMAILQFRGHEAPIKARKALFAPFFSSYFWWNQFGP